MPPISAVICLHGEREFLERLLQNSEGCYDDLVVVHDGSDTFGIKELVERFHGRFFERPRAFQQEPHWPFAFGEAKHDWILHLDADEFPSVELRQWLLKFRNAAEPGNEVSGFTCVWPLWNGRRAVSEKWPDGRIFLVHKFRVRFFGMAEGTFVPDGVYLPVSVVVRHEPRRKSYGLHNVLIRKQAYRWREAIARSLLKSPRDLACWRWDSEAWPSDWEEIRQRPLLTGFRRLVMGTLRNIRRQWRGDRSFSLDAALNGPVHHAMLCAKFWRLSRQRKKLRHGR